MKLPSNYARFFDAVFEPETSRSVPCGVRSLPLPKRQARQYKYDPLTALRLRFIRPTFEESRVTLEEWALLAGTITKPSYCQKCQGYSVVRFQCRECGWIIR